MSQKVDVFICGGGPVGLLLSYQLVRLNLQTYTVEQYDKTQQAMYGRATTLYQRSLEMLDQLDLADDFSQIGFIAKGSVTFKDGKRIHGRGWDFIVRPYDTYFNHCLNIRQRNSEDVIRDALVAAGSEVHAGAKLLNYVVNESAEDDYKIDIDIQDEEGRPLHLKAKYIVGADGGRSTVRRIANIPFIGDQTPLHWIRIDALIETDMPDLRVGFGAIESRTHGNILIVALDHGVTRIGYSITQELYDKHGGNFTEELVKEEAVKALAPFSLKFKKVEWWTLYSIGQRVAERFQDQERILLAGDAGHTHSSGSAQGMNTGIHDAVNLGWKLAGVIKGWYKPSVLATYSPERRAVAQHLINLDKDISTLISGKIPKGYPSTTVDPNIALDELFEKFAQFTIGLGVKYEQDGLLNKDSTIASVNPGHRGPDVVVRKPGNSLSTRLYELTKNNGKFWIVIFAGAPTETSEQLKELRSYLDSSESFTKRLTLAYNFVTVIAGPGPQPDEVLGVRKFGNAYYDVDHSAHIRYGISANRGGIVVLRPDGIFSYAAPLSEGAEVGAYLDGIIVPK